jgi:hypothetical protein
MALAVVATIAGLDAADRHWRTWTKAPQPAKAERPPQTANNDARPDNRKQPDDPAPLVKLKFVSVDSEETSAQHGYGENAVDGNPDTYWHTEWQNHSPGPPHEIIIELVPPAIIRGFTYLPPQVESDHGIIRDYEFYVSNDGRNFGQPVKKGAFKQGKEIKTESFAPVKCRFIKLKAISEINGLPWTSAAEIGVIQDNEEVSR